MKTSFWRRWSNSLQVMPVRSVSVRPRRRRLALQALEDRITLSLTPQMVFDINTTTQSSDPSRMTAIGSTTYFVGDDGVHGFELWKSDGTDTGTVLVKDIYPGVDGESSFPRDLTNVDGTLFFAAEDGTHGVELWKSDGTAAGTVLVKDIFSGGYGSGPYSLTNANGTLFFSAYTDATGWELWKSDGTASGTVLVKDIFPGIYSSGLDYYPLTNLDGTLFFMANDGVQGWGLWKSDGTASGTVLVKDVFPGGDTGYYGGYYPYSSSLNSLTDVNGTLFFSAYGETTGWELWKSDGTASGTVLVKDIFPGGYTGYCGGYYPSSSYPSYLTNVNGTLFFSAYGETTGWELWKSDGTEVGTVIVRAATFAQNMTDVDGTLFFTSDDDHFGTGLWKSDGSAAGTLLVADVDASNLTNVDGTLFFSANATDGSQVLWKSDGTAAGTVLVKDGFSLDVSDCSWYDSPLANVNGTLMFVASDGMHGTELWKSDGTAAGTVLVKDINSRTQSSSPGNMLEVSGTLFFTANDGIHGTELWKSDGTVSGTTLVKDIVPGGHTGYNGGYYPNGSSPSNLTNVNGTLFFTTWSGGTESQLWKSDGTEAGTVMVRAATSAWNLTDVDGTLFFTANDGLSGTELWKSDGTEAGTTLVKDIYAGGQWVYWGGYYYYGGTWQYALNSSSPDELTNVDGMLFFTAHDGTHGSELWQSDGTEAGTVLVKDIWPGYDYQRPFQLTDVNGTLFFSANDGTHGSELWQSDGTAAGTVLVKDIAPGIYSSVPHDLVNLDGTVMFAARTATAGIELWQSDGTEGGTVLVKDIFPGGYTGYYGGYYANSSYLSNLTNVNGRLFFRATDGTTGYELWQSDGTEAGTMLVMDIVPGMTSSYTDNLTNVSGTLFFTAHDSALWRSDGTESGTVRVADLLSVSFQSLIDVSGTLFFAASDTVHGWELWKISSDADTTGPIAEQVIVNQGLVDPPDLPGHGRSTSWSQQRSDLRRIEIVFNEPVRAQVGDIRLINLGLDAGQDPPREVPLTDYHFRLDGASVVLEFAPGELSDGVYAVEVASTVTDLHGNPLSNGGHGQTITGNEQNGLFRLAGDWNGDGGTSIFDFPTLAYWFGQSTPTAPEYLDLNQDLGVSIFDFVLFARAFDNQVRFAPGLGSATESSATESSAALSPVPSTLSDRVDSLQQSADADRRRAVALHEFMLEEARRPWRTIDRLDLAQQLRASAYDGEANQMQGSFDEWLDVNV